MVLLTIVTNSNPHTIYFDHPIEKPSYIRLLSASLYNSWYNLEENGPLLFILDLATGGNSQSSGGGSPTYARALQLVITLQKAWQKYNNTRTSKKM